MNEKILGFLKVKIKMLDSSISENQTNIQDVNKFISEVGYSSPDYRFLKSQKEGLEREGFILYGRKQALKDLIVVLSKENFE